jgi:hypothetical protein
VVLTLSELDLDFFNCGKILFVGGFCQVRGNVEGNHCNSLVFPSMPVVVFLPFGVIFIIDVCSVVEAVGAQ